MNSLNLDKMKGKALDSYIDESTEQFKKYFEGYPEEGFKSLRTRLRTLRLNKINTDLSWIGLK